LEDFIAKAQERWPKGARLVLVPLAINTALQPEQHQLLPWLRFAYRIPAKFVSVSMMSLDHLSSSIQEGPRI
jgi:hypothetical protein